MIRSLLKWSTIVNKRRTEQMEKDAVVLYHNRPDEETTGTESIYFALYRNSRTGSMEYHCASHGV